MSELYFTQTKLTMLGKTGKATPDEDGYYEICVGALNAFNNTGSWYYTADGVIELFGPGTIFHRRITNGALRGEVEHPAMKDGESMESFCQRLGNIDPKNTCAHFKAVWLDKDFGKKNPQYNNPDMIGIFAKVKPIPPHGHILQSALDNPNENVCFSIRALATQKLVRGKLVRTITEVLTFDLVNEGGITVASKWDTPATETAETSLDANIISPVTQRILQNIAEKSKNANVFSLESGAVAEYILKKYFASTDKPIYHKW